METLNVHSSPKNIFETNTLQHTFKFCAPLECFLQFRLVCKHWLNAVETIRFDRFNCTHKVFETYSTHPNFLSKFLKVFKKFEFDCNCYWRSDIDWYVLGALVVNNTKNLNEVDLDHYPVQLRQVQKTKLDQILEKSKHTLTKIFYSDFPYPNVAFPNVTQLEIQFGDHIDFEEFRANFPQLLTNCENLKFVKIYHESENPDVHVQYIGRNYPKHCISGYTYCLGTAPLQHLPLKILMWIQDLHVLDQTKYSGELEYITVYACATKIMENGWNRYQEIFDQCNKLKQIAFQLWTNEPNYKELELSDLKEDEFNVWNKRMEYLKRRGIEFVHRDQVEDNEILQAKVAKENGLKWRFEFGEGI